jgi:hypothetical protein
VIQVRREFTSSKAGVSAAATGEVEGVSLMGRLVLPRFLSLPIKPLGVIGVGGSVLEEAGTGDESSGQPDAALCRSRAEK